MEHGDGSLKVPNAPARGAFATALPRAVLPRSLAWVGQAETDRGSVCSMRMRGGTQVAVKSRVKGVNQGLDLDRGLYRWEQCDVRNAATVDRRWVTSFFRVPFWLSACSCRSTRPTCIPALPFCHVTLRGRKPLPRAYPGSVRTLGDHLCRRRLDLGLLQREVAERLGADECTVTNWELNRT